MQRSRNEAQRAHWDSAFVLRVLAPLGLPVVLLKGAAYRALGLPNAPGRLSNDLDLLVPAADIPRIEAALRTAGWERAAMPPPQERCFHDWMHELPPFVHAETGAKLDVHHNILPRIDRVRIDPAMLFASALHAPDGSLVLCPADMLLHSSIRLFRRGDFGNGLRDLLDFRDMALWFGRDPAFWKTFLDRTDRLGLRVPVYLSLRATHRLLGALWPAEAIRRTSSWGPLWPPRAWLDLLVRTAANPPRLDGRHGARSVALWLLARYPLCLWRKSIIPKVQRLVTARGRSNA